MKASKRIFSMQLGVYLIACTLLAAPASAQATVQDPEFSLELEDLTDEIRPRPAGTDVADTALVFSNRAAGARRAHCVGWDGRGNRVGGLWVVIPAHGSRYVLASHISGGADFVGQVICGSSSQVFGSVVFIGPDLTDLSVVQVPGTGRGRMFFPLVATY